MVSILFGYDVGIMSAAEIFMAEGLQLTTIEVELAVSSLNLVAAIGSLVAGRVAAKYGRKGAMWFCCIVFILGAVLLTLANGFTLVLIGRVFEGIAVGCALMIAPMYTSEISPPELRGVLVSFSDIMINTGLVLGYLLGLLIDLWLEPVWKWRVMVGIGIIPPIAIGILLFYLPESPRWLVMQHENDKALAVLEQISPSEEKAKETLDCIVAIHHDAEEASWFDTLNPKDAVMQRIVLIVIFLGFWQQASGSEALVYYVPLLMEDAGGGSLSIELVGALLAGLFKLFGEIISLFFVDTQGRRTLLIGSGVLNTISLVCVALSFMTNNSWLQISMICLNLFCFSLGMGTVTWVSASELLPLHMKNKGYSMCVAVNRFISGICALTFVSMYEAMGFSAAFGLYACAGFLGATFYYFLVPETKGKTLEEIQISIKSGSL